MFRTIKDLEQAMRSNLLDQIKREKYSRERALKSFQEARKLTTSQAAARIALLKKPLQQLDQLQRNIEALAKLITSHDDDPSGASSMPANSTEPSSPDDKSGQNNHSWADADE